MQRAEIDKMHQLEESHWWFQGKKYLVTSALEELSVPAGAYLDIGCGTGMFLREIGKEREACGVDISWQALSYCREDGLSNLFQGSCETLPFAAESFSLVTLLDIIEHVDDDIAVLKESCRVCRPGGVLVVTVPAFMFLWGRHDQANHHKRRYTRAQLGALGVSAGFRVERLTYTNFAIFLPAFLRRTLLRHFAPAGGSDLAPTPRALNELLKGIYRLEASFLKRADFPVGVSLLMILRKPG